MNTLKIDVAIVESSMAILQEIKNVSIDVQPLLEYPKGSIPFNRWPHSLFFFKHVILLFNLETPPSLSSFS